MSPPRFDPTVSVKDVISLLALVITGVIAFQAVSSRVDALEKSDSKQEQRIQALEETNTALKEMIIDIRADVRFLRRDVEEDRKREGK